MSSDITFIARSLTWTFMDAKAVVTIRPRMVLRGHCPMSSTSSDPWLWAPKCCRAQWQTPVIPEPRRSEQEDHEFKVSLWPTQQAKTKPNTNQERRPFDEPAPGTPSPLYHVILCFQSLLERSPELANKRLRELQEDVALLGTGLEDCIPFHGYRHSDDI